MLKPTHIHKLTKNKGYSALVLALGTIPSSAASFFHLYNPLKLAQLTLGGNVHFPDALQNLESGRVLNQHQINLFFALSH